MNLSNHAKRKRSRSFWTSAACRCAVGGVLLAAGVTPASRAQSAAEPAPALTLAPPERNERSKPERELLERLDAALTRKQFAMTLELIAKAPAAQRTLPAVCCRAAEARLGLGQPLGRTAVRSIPNGRPGQFDSGWLLVEKQAAEDAFLCAPPDSALVQVRRALDGGFDEPRVHVAHARVWLKAGQPDTAWSILKAREAVLLDDSFDASEAFADVALARGAIEEFLKYSSRHAERNPQQRVEILHAAYLTAAERYNQRGDENLNRAMLSRALELKAERPDLMLELADALWEVGEKADAGKWYRRVIDAQPGHRQRDRILERIGQ